VTAPGISLYVHVPFCRAKCGYCAFCSYPRPEPELQRSVVRRTLAQAASWVERLGGLESPTAYVGGGTPSVLPPDVLEELLRGLAALWGQGPQELTVEANPESLTPAFLERCSAGGVTRVSLGVQTFSGPLRAAVGRRCTDAEIDSALDLLAREWSGAVSLDLISGLPGQRPGDVAVDVERAASFRPAHVSLYALTLEHEGSGLRTAEGADELWIEGRKRLEELGYPAYEVANFAPPGRECRHNLRYWELEPYLGVGPSAVSTVPDGRGGVLRVENARSLEDFLGTSDPLGPVSVESVGPADFVFETLIMGLRLVNGLGAAALERRFGAPLARLLPRTLERWGRKGLLAHRPGRIGLNPRGLLILDSLLLEAREEIDTLPEGAVNPVWP
jgi:oxygen-independent coproporphyrinogen III oxidase